MLGLSSFFLFISFLHVFLNLTKTSANSSVMSGLIKNLTIIMGSTPTLPEERVEANQSAWLGVSGSPS